MTMNETHPDAPRTPSTKKPYEKPSFRYEQVFVTTALSCGKVVGFGGDCATVPKAS